MSDRRTTLDQSTHETAASGDEPHVAAAKSSIARPFFPPAWSRLATRARAVFSWNNVTRRVVLNLTIIGAAICLYLGVTEPVLKLERLFVFTDEHSMWSIINALVQKDELFLAVIIGTFSILFPALKLLYLLIVAAAPARPSASGKQLLAALSWLGKWSMLDVLVLALVIFYAKSNDFADAATLPGVYYFTASVVLTLIAYSWVKRGPE